MREALAFVFLILLVMLGWKQPFESHLRAVAVAPAQPPAGEITPRPAARAPTTRSAVVQTITPRASPTPPADWIHGRTKMDAPYSQKEVQRAR
jgi:hypothetical protein